MSPPELMIRIKKHKDGTATLRCERPDGSATWHHQKGGQARFFPTHDLTHYAVETVLGLRQGFYGLLADGWNITDFEERDRRTDMPMEAGTAELIVGFLDTERASGSRWTAAEFNEHAQKFATARKATIDSHLTQRDLDSIRARRSELFDRWNALEPGDTLNLVFERSA